MKIGFDSEKYIKLQTEEILKRAKMFDNKLYIEFGGKLFDDYHASRVLPGLYPDIKLRVLKALGDDVEVLYCVSAKDIEKNRSQIFCGSCRNNINDTDNYYDTL